MTSNETKTGIEAVDWTDIRRRCDDLRTRAAERRRAEWTALLAELRARGVTRVETGYDGGGRHRTGTIVTVPAGTDIAAIRDSLAAFALTLARRVHPGFESGTGGAGRVTWDVVENRVVVEIAADCGGSAG